MKSASLLIALLISAHAFAATTTTPAPKTTEAPKPPVSDAPAGPRLTSSFKIVRLDGMTVIQQGTLSTNPATMATINVSGSDAFVNGVGRCAFNVRYEEVSSTAVSNTTNRLFSNDTLIAQNTAISLVPNVAKAIVTQPYLFPGLNYVKLVVNAEGKTPATAWIKVNVTGNCGTVNFKPGSAEWNKLFLAYGYSNYATTQLKTKNYARYADLAKLNADLTAAVNAKTVEQAAFNSLMSRWNSFLNDPAFNAAMAKLLPGTPGVK